MARSKSSARWLREHFTDEYVKRAQQEGYRSRAVYKLLEIDEKDRLLRPGMTVVDLGAAPGGWSQLAARLVGGQGAVVALDLLPMEPIAGVDFILGDFREDAVLAQLQSLVGNTQVDLVLSDMAPNLSGIASVDAARIEHISELALDFAQHHLHANGALLIKTFHGAAYDGIVKQFRATFKQVHIRKPKASRPQSAETFILGRGLK